MDMTWVLLFQGLSCLPIMVPCTLLPLSLPCLTVPLVSDHWSFKHVLTPHCLMRYCALKPCCYLQKNIPIVHNPCRHVNPTPYLCRWVPVAERSRSLALVYSGMFVGSIAGEAA